MSPLLRVALLLSCLICLLPTRDALAARRARWHGAREKAGPFMINLKLGASIPIYYDEYSGNPLDFFPASFAIQLEGGVALDRGRHAYLVLPFEVQVGTKSYFATPLAAASETFTKIIVPLGFQYDFGIPGVPGLYLYPRASLGYAAFINSGGLSVPGLIFSSSNTLHGGVFAPELGIKYIFGGRVQLGLEPFSLPVHFFRVGSVTATLLDYRLHAYVGGIF